MDDLPRYRPTVARVDLAAIRRNLGTMRARLSGAGVSILAAVKADAYGHGLLPVARALSEEGVDWLGVALTEEGLELRRAAISTPILVLGGFADGSEPRALDAGLTPVLYRSASARALNAIAARRQIPVGVHLKIDTGMNRLGVPMAELPAFLDLLDDLEHVYIDGVMTHLAEAEAADTEFTEGQLAAFARAIGQVRSRGHRPRWLHGANSAGVMTHQGLAEPAGCNLVRPGLALYGIAPDDRLEGVWPLEPALSFESAISFLKRVPAGAKASYGLTWTARRPTKLATLPVGYGDGYLRAFGNRAEVLIRGRRAPVVGRVCMDLCLVDVTDVPRVREGDRAILLGSQSGQRIGAGELARLVDTIPYEIICAISPRVPRVYRDEPVV